MLENGPDDIGVENKCDDSHVGATSQTTKRLDLEDALQEFGPSVPSCLELGQEPAPPTSLGEVSACILVSVRIPSLRHRALRLTEYAP